MFARPLFAVIFLIIAHALTTTSLVGNPLWTDIGPNLDALLEPVSVHDLVEEEPEGLQGAGMQTMSLPGIGESISAEIQALAESLGNDTLAIFNFVRNHIDYEHYHGLRKGPELTLLEGSGNDFDQCVLLAELLHAAGHNDIEYIYQRTGIPYSGNDGINLSQWLGLAEEPYPGVTFEDIMNVSPETYFGEPVDNVVAKQILYGYSFLNFRGSVNVAYDPANFPDGAILAFNRLRLRVVIDGNPYDFDPSFKRYEQVNGLELLGQMGYDRSDLLAESAIGATVAADYVQNLNEDNIVEYLEDRTSDLLAFLQDHHPNASISEVIGGRRIIPEDAEALAAASPLSDILYGSGNTWTEIPNNQKTRVRFRSGAIDTTLYTAELRGRRISLTFNGNNALLWLDDEQVDSRTLTASNMPLRITIYHPNQFGYQQTQDQNGNPVMVPPEETKTYRKNNGFVYSIIYCFSSPGRLLQKRYEQLNAYLDAGLEDDSREVRSELLNIMGLTWMNQTYLVGQLIKSETHALSLSHHRFGRMAQEEGFYVDVGLQLSSTLSADGIGAEVGSRAFHLGSLFGSALEHGIIEQMQPGTSAVSTVNILREANRATNPAQRIYQTDQSNWNTIRDLLTNYSDGKDDIEDYIMNQNARALLPRDADVNQGIWSGTGYVIRAPGVAGMIIAGGYSGGYSTSIGNVYSPPIYNYNYSNPITTYNTTSLPSLKPLATLPTLTSAKHYGSDPVDMATGGFIYAEDDLKTGTEPAPRGLAFTRHYSSNANQFDAQHLGYGWTHNLHIRATERTSTEAAFGGETPAQMASFLTAYLIGADLYREDGNAQEWVTAALAVGWFVDRMLDNAVSITLGQDTIQFIRQPDGSFSPPAGITMGLEEVGGNYRLTQRLGNTIHFDSDNRAEKIVDPYGMEMAFHYHGDNRLDYVEDAYGRRHTFSYDGDNRIERVTDSTDNRFVEFEYDNEGNLIRSTDPEGKHFYFDYEVTGDPGETEASEHRIVRMRNHDNETVTHNVYNTLGIVVEQYLHGDTDKTWKLHFTGSINSEEDPEGGFTRYHYDERQRVIAKTDPEGNTTTWVYNGQDHRVEIISPEGENTFFHYDGHHNLVQIDHPRGGGSTVYTYDGLHRPLSVTDAEGSLTEYVYYTSGPHADNNRPYKIIDPTGTTTFEYYDSGTGIGKVWRISDGDGLVVENTYDTYGQPLSTVAPGGFTTTYQYTSRGDPYTETDPNGVQTRYVHNLRRQVTQVIRDYGGPDEAVEEFTYNNAGLPERATAPSHNDGLRSSIFYEYSPTELPRFEYEATETASSPGIPVREYRYDGRDRVIRVFDAANRETQIEYWANEHPHLVTRPLSRISEYLFDRDGREIAVTSPGSPTNRLVEVTYGVTDAGEGDQTTGYPRTTVTDADELTTVIEENRLGDLRFYTNKRGEVFEFGYDELRRLTEVITPLDAANSRSHLNSYTHRGELLGIIRPSGKTIDFTYHPTNGRLASVAYSDGVDTVTTQYTPYDNNGNLLGLSEDGQTITRTYDNLGRVNGYTDVNGKTISYRYYPNGHIRKLIYPGGDETSGHVEYAYWKNGLLKTVTDRLGSGGDRVSTFYWNDDGKLARIVRPNGTERIIRYDDAGRPEIVEEATSDGQLIALYKNSYHPSDDLAWRFQLPLKRTELVDDQDNSVPQRRRLKSDVPQGGLPSPVESMTYRSDNSLESFEAQSVTYDADGNMVYGPLPDRSFGSYDYDLRDRLVSAGGLTYGYDPENQRVSISGPDGTTSFLNEVNLGLSQVLERTKNSETTRYVWGVGLLYEIDESGEAVYYHYDNVGNTIALTDDDEAVIERIEYSPFGIITYRKSDYDTPFLFTGFFGNQTDDNGLLYMRARYYNPLTRAFINADPAREGWNWHGYAAGNPLTYVDPTGLGVQSVLNAVQTSLSFLGLVPVFGEIFDIANAGISMARGNYAEAAVHLAAAIPGVGQAVTMGKFATMSVGITARVSKTRAARTTTGASERLVIGRGSDLSRPGTLRPGEHRLSWPPTGATRTEWKVNSGLLRQEMRRGNPIRDASPGNNSGMYLNAERNLLRDRGWTFDSNTNLWMPPTP